MSKAARQRTARERLAEERRRQAQLHKRMRTTAIVLGVVAVIAIIVVGAVIIQNRRNTPAGYRDVLAPQSRQPDGSIVMAKPGVTGPVLEIFEDFQCPACKSFEEVNGDTMKRLAAQGKVKVVFRPFRLFQQGPPQANSQRAANAAACAPADKWVSFHDIIFRNQPREGDEGFGNEDLIGWAKEVGIDDSAFAKCVNGNEKDSVVQQATQFAASAGIKGTPTLKLNGVKLDDNITYTKAGLESAIMNAAAQQAPAPSSTPTPAKTSK